MRPIVNRRGEHEKIHRHCEREARGNLVKAACIFPGLLRAYGTRNDGVFSGTRDDEVVCILTKWLA